MIRSGKLYEEYKGEAYCTIDISGWDKWENEEEY